MVQIAACNSRTCPTEWQSLVLPPRCGLSESPCEQSSFWHYFAPPPHLTQPMRWLTSPCCISSMTPTIASTFSADMPAQLNGLSFLCHHIAVGRFDFQGLGYMIFRALSPEDTAAPSNIVSIAYQWGSSTAARTRFLAIFRLRFVCDSGRLVRGRSTTAGGSS